MKAEKIEWYKWHIVYYQRQMAVTSMRCSQLRREVKLLEATLKELKNKKRRKLHKVNTKAR